MNNLCVWWNSGTMLEPPADRRVFSLRSFATPSRSWRSDSATWGSTSWRETTGRGTPRPPGTSCSRWTCTRRSCRWVRSEGLWWAACHVSIRVCHVSKTLFLLSRELLLYLCLTSCRCSVNVCREWRPGWGQRSRMGVWPGKRRTPSTSCRDRWGSLREVSTNTRRLWRWCADCIKPWRKYVVNAKGQRSLRTWTDVMMSLCFNSITSGVRTPARRSLVSGSFPPSVAARKPSRFSTGSLRSSSGRRFLSRRRGSVRSVSWRSGCTVSNRSTGF